jgi:hypothetical protein
LDEREQLVEAFGGARSEGYGPDPA